MIGRLAQDNPDWGAPKIHAELQKLGFSLAERTVARYLPRAVRRRDPGQKWLAFLENHREAIAAFDFFTVPTETFRMLYCFFVIEHQRRKILHCNVTPHPTQNGSSSNYGRHSRNLAVIATSSSMGIKSSMRRC